MHATIRCFDAGARSPAEIDAGVRGLAAVVGPLPGFVALVVLDAGAGRLAAVSLFESATALAAADRRLKRWLAAQPAPLRWTADDEAATGEVVYQRGL
jgi:hypothetical protein